MENKIFDNNLPITFLDFNNDQTIKIHQQLFNDALKKFENDRKNIDNTFSLDDYRVIEIKNEYNYLLPSSIIIFHKHDFKKEKLSLEKYWNTNYKENNLPFKFNELLIDDDNKKHIEFEDIDYIHGKIKFRNKFTNKTFTIDKSKIDFNITYKNKLENTFGNIYNNSISQSKDKNLKSKVEKQTLDGIYKIK